MLTSQTVENLAHIARNGGGFVISARAYTVENLAHIVRNMQAGACIEIGDSNAMTTENLAHISRNAVGQVIFS